ncbi:MAG: PEP-CTERM sorting domain-containing protein [Desulfobacterales bacterium]|nr:PEP-CTERM sorting domain-containing protein [Desulfobacterales bacterium]
MKKATLIILTSLAAILLTSGSAMALNTQPAKSVQFIESIQAVSEPAAMILLGVALIGAAGWGRRSISEKN